MQRDRTSRWSPSGCCPRTTSTGPQEELVPLLGIIEDAVRTLAADGRWRVHHVGTLDLLPAQTQTVLKEAEEATAHVDGNTGQRRRRLRRPPGDRRRGALAARWSTPDDGTSIEDLAEVRRRRPHLRAPLHRAASPTPTW